MPRSNIRSTLHTMLSLQEKPLTTLFFIAGVLTFGLGDLATTLYFIHYTPMVEANPIVQTYLSFHPLTFVAFKLIFLIFCFILWGVHEQHTIKTECEDNTYEYINKQLASLAVPLVITIYGTIAVVWNLYGIIFVA